MSKNITAAPIVTPKGETYAEKVLKELETENTRMLIRPAYGRRMGKAPGRSMDINTFEEL
jgi:hypothetical protein